MAAAIELTSGDWLAIEREYCQRSLANFVRQAWPILEPNTTYVHGWHIDAVCEHLEAVTAGEITRLLINVPPGTMKSLLAGVFWPAWEWGPKGIPTMRFLGASHAERYALRDARKMRQVIESPWFQRLWPLRLANDQNAAGTYENENRGFRHAMPVRSMTGSRGDRVLWDDPHSVEGAISPAEMASTGRVFHETLPTRINDPSRSAIVIVMQRLAVGDVSDLALEQDYEHLVLPMEHEPKHPRKSTRFADPRTKPGELLCPDRFPRDVVERDKKVMGSHATAGQLQQRPAPRGGAMFQVDQIRVLQERPRPKDIVKLVRYWDKAGTEGGGAYSAGVLMARLKDGTFVVLHVDRGQWSSGKRERRIKQCAETDGRQCQIWIEQEPGSGGKESAENTITNLAGWTIRAERVTGDKVTRADPFSIQVEAGNVAIVTGDWNREFLDELEVFPMGRYKDQVDAASGAFNKATTGGNYAALAEL